LVSFDVGKPWNGSWQNIPKLDFKNSREESLLYFR